MLLYTRELVESRDSPLRGHIDQLIATATITGNGPARLLDKLLDEMPDGTVDDDVTLLAARRLGHIGGAG